MTDSKTTASKPSIETKDPLSIEVNQLKLDFQALHEQLMKERELVYELQQKEVTYKKKIQQLESSNEKKFEENKLLCKVLAGNREKQDLATALQEKDALEIQVASLKLALSEISSTPPEIPTQNNHKISSESNGENNDASAKSEIQELKSQIAVLESSLQSSEEEVETIRRQLENKTALWSRDEKRLISEAKAADEKIAMLLKSQNEKAAENEAQLSDVQSLKNSIEQLKEEHDLKLRGLTRKKTQMLAQLSSLQEECNQKDDILEKTENELLQIKKERAALSEKLEAMSTELRQVQENLEQIESKFENCELQLQQSVEDCDTKDKLNKELDAKYNELLPRLDEQNKVIDAAKQQIDELTHREKISDRRTVQLIKDLKLQLAKQRKATELVSEEKLSIEKELELQKLVYESTLEKITKEHEKDMESAIAKVQERNESQFKEKLQQAPLSQRLGISTLVQPPVFFAKEQTLQEDSTENSVDHETLKKINKALAERLESLLTTNASLNEKVQYLENCIQSLTAELQFGKRHFQNANVSTMTNHSIKFGGDESDFDEHEEVEL